MCSENDKEIVNEEVSVKKKKDYKQYGKVSLLFGCATLIGSIGILREIINGGPITEITSAIYTNIFGYCACYDPHTEWVAGYMAMNDVLIAHIGFTLGIFSLLNDNKNNGHARMGVLLCGISFILSVILFVIYCKTLMGF